MGANETEDAKTEYKKKATAFSECYDKSNPLTSKKGTLRLIGIQIEDIEANVAVVEEGVELTDA